MTMILGSYGGRSGTAVRCYVQLVAAIEDLRSTYDSHLQALLREKPPQPVSY